MDRTVVLLVSQNLCLYDIVLLSSVCHLWHALFESEDMWRSLYAHSIHFTPYPIDLTIPAKEQYKKKYKAWLHLQRGECSRKVLDLRVEGHLLYATEKYYFEGGAGFRIYDINSNTCVGGCRPDSIETEYEGGITEIHADIYCDILRCDGTYILAKERVTNQNCMLTIWRLSDVLKGNEEPIRSICDNAQLLELQAMEFNSHSKLIVLQSHKYNISILHFETFEVLCECNSCSEEVNYSLTLGLHDKFLLIASKNRFSSQIKVGKAKLQLLDLSVPSNPKKIWSKQGSKLEEKFPFVYFKDDYLAFGTTTAVDFKFQIYNFPKMKLLYTLQMFSGEAIVSLNPHIGCFAVGNNNGKIQVYNFRNQKMIYLTDPSPFHISKWAYRYTDNKISKLAHFLHLSDDKLLVQSGSYTRKMTFYDFAAGSTPSDPDSDDDSDPNVYNFCTISVCGVPYFFINARVYLPKWQKYSTRHEHKILPEQFKPTSSFSLGSEDFDVDFYKYVHESAPDTKEAMKKGREALLLLGLTELPEMALKLIEEQVVPDLAVYDCNSELYLIE